MVHFSCGWEQQKGLTNSVAAKGSHGTKECHGMTLRGKFPQSRGRSSRRVLDTLPTRTFDSTDQISSVSGTNFGAGQDLDEDDVLSPEMGQGSLNDVDPILAAEESNLQIVPWEIRDEVSAISGPKDESNIISFLDIGGSSRLRRVVSFDYLDDISMHGQISHDFSRCIAITRDYIAISGDFSLGVRSPSWAMIHEHMLKVIPRDLVYKRSSKSVSWAANFIFLDLPYGGLSSGYSVSPMWDRITEDHVRAGIHLAWNTLSESRWLLIMASFTEPLQFDATFGDEGFTESSKLCHVAMHFQKSARQWWASLRANGEAPKTWKALRTFIMKQFLASDAKDKVLTKWRSLKLSPYESIHKYVDKFWDLHLKATVYKKIYFEEQKQQFCAGLLEDMNEYVNSQRPRSISVVIHHTMVATRSNFQQGAKRNLKPMEAKEKQEYKGKNFEKGNSNNNKAKEKGVFKGKNELTPEELERYRKENKCFKCGEQGHSYRSCPQRNPRNEV
ncbi:hypothetical protein L7F22_011232 [Adiantum nelumboides]|nr:hypothetical protein [Adiantum nelumboides]